MNSPLPGVYCFFFLGEQLTGFNLWIYNINIISFVRKLPCHQLFKPNKHVLICGGLQTAKRARPVSLSKFGARSGYQPCWGHPHPESTHPNLGPKFGAYRFAICCRRRTKYLIFNPQNSAELTENQTPQNTGATKSHKIGPWNWGTFITPAGQHKVPGPNGSHLPGLVKVYITNWNITI